jgi:hypothetical protein
MQAQLRAKADEAATTKATTSLTDRLNSSETSLSLGLRALRDKTAATLDAKVDAATLKKWQQDINDSIAELRAHVSRASSSHPAAGGSPQYQRARGYEGRAGASSSQSPPRLPRHSPRQQVAEGYWAYGTAPVTTASAAAALADVLAPLGPVPPEASTSEVFQHKSGSVSECVAAAEAALSASEALHQAAQQPAGGDPAVPQTAQQQDAVAAAAAAPTAGVSDTGDSAAVGSSQAGPAPGAAQQQQQEGVVVVGAINVVTDQEPSSPTAPMASTPLDPLTHAPAELPMAKGPLSATSSSQAVAAVDEVEQNSGVAGTGSGPVDGSVSAATAAENTGSTVAPPADTLHIAGDSVADSSSSSKGAAAPLAGVAPVGGHSEQQPGRRSGTGARTSGSSQGLSSPSAAPASPQAHAGPGSVRAAQHGRSQSHFDGQLQPAGVASLRIQQRSLSHRGTATEAGSLREQQAAHAARPFSALQPWSVPKSPPSTSVSELHSAATNAKLVLAGQQKEATRQQLVQKKLPQKGLPGSPSGGSAVP